MNKALRAIAIYATTLTLLTSCLNQGSNGGKSASVSGNASFSKSGGSASNSPALDETQCLIFKNNSKDYSTCLGCKNTLCSCASSSCTTAELAACAVNQTVLIQCVHENLVVSGGVCTGLKCGDSQVADFTACLCRDATPPGSITPAPGQEDTSTPYLEPGFFIANRFCPVSNASDLGPSGTGSDTLECFSPNGGGASAAAPHTNPLYETKPPVNIFQDVGYLRWDLALDASQFSAAGPMIEKQRFKGSHGTVPATFSMFYQLKPKTKLSTAMANKVTWNDCIEHFSGYTNSGGANFLSTNNFCDARTGSTASTAPTPVTLASTSGFSGTGLVENVSLNGGAANRNLLLLSSPGNNPIAATIAATGVTAKGVAKRDNGGDITGGVSTGGVLATAGTGMLSNIGYYKFSWDGVRVQKDNAAAADPDVASGSVSGRIAISANLGFTPGSMVESTALSPEAVLNSVQTRDCSSASVQPSPCVTTGVYRTSGGAILTQSYSNRFTNNHHASSVGALPSGITAVGTPKIVEDIAQDLSTSASPARLRVFARAADGNIYMSKLQNTKWNAWQNLGRPWVCNPVAANCLALINSLPPPQQPYINALAYSATPNPNNGLSIAGEPIVASYMDTTASNVPGIIAVFVRVSQLNSTDGNIGPFHGAVFYTFARTTTLASGGNYDFDNLLNWSSWRPIKDGSNNIMHVQGNPDVFVQKVGATPMFHVFATEGLNVGRGTPTLHPPIAPSVANYKTDSLAAYWYNYGVDLIMSGVAVPAASSVTSETWSDWSVAGVTRITADTGLAIASDWTHSPVNTGQTTQSSLYKTFSTVRLLATELVTQACATTALASRSPCVYTRQLLWRDIDLTAAGPILTATCAQTQGVYNQLNFTGNVWPVNLHSSTASATSLADPADSGAKKMLVFGRAVCSDRSKCDPVNPTLAYGTVFSTCNPTAVPRNTMYYAGFASHWNGAAATTTSDRMITNFNPTSDVYASYSAAMDIASSDAPVYYITRDPDGKVSNGFFGSFEQLNKGVKIFQIFSTGGFAN